MEPTLRQQLADWLRRSRKQAEVEVVRAEYELERSREKLAMLEQLQEAILSAPTAELR